MSRNVKDIERLRRMSRLVSAVIILTILLGVASYLVKIPILLIGSIIAMIIFVYTQYAVLRLRNDLISGKYKSIDDYMNS